MIRVLATLILLNISVLLQATDEPEQFSWTMVKPGDNVTILTCTISKQDASLFYWYKQRFGYFIQTIAMGKFGDVKPQGKFVNSRFNSIQKGTVQFLTIENVTKEDEATYLCQAGSVYEMKFLNATFLTVHDERNQISVYVEQHPRTLSVKSGKPASLQCSLVSDNKENSSQCPGEHDVHWFRAGTGQNLPSIFYTEKMSEERNKSKCVYQLSKTIQDSSDSGTYYCAVATCGHILFGEGTEIKTDLGLWPVFIVLALLVGCGVTGIITLILRRNHICQHSEGAIAASNSMVLEDRTVDSYGHYTGENHEAMVNYAMLDFPSRRKNRSTITSEFPQDCVYSGLSG